MKESLTVNSFCVISDRTRTKNFASLYVGVPIAERISLNGGNPFIRRLCTCKSVNLSMFYLWRGIVESLEWHCTRTYLTLH